MEKKDSFWVYIVTNWKKTVLYVGVTNDLGRRLAEHYGNRGQPDTFAGRYFCYNLIYYELHTHIANAIAREKEIKKLSRKQKDALVGKFNPDWKFFNDFVCGTWPPRLSS